jgi:hypothetical protein
MSERTLATRLRHYMEYHGAGVDNWVGLSQMYAAAFIRLPNMGEKTLRYARRELARRGLAFQGERPVVDVWPGSGMDFYGECK